MKLSAFLAISVPLLAVSTQTPANAADALADTGSWLKSSIATLKPVAKPAAKPAMMKVAHAAPAGSAPVVKLRPFVPNRYLPRERDLKQALMSQQAQMDTSYADVGAANASLSGQVSANTYVAPHAASPYDQYEMSGRMFSQAPAVVPQKPIKVAKKAAAGTRSPRVVPGQAQMLPEQLTQNAPAVQPVIPEPPVQRQNAQRPQFPMSMPVASFAQPQQNMPQQCNTTQLQQQQQYNMMQQQQQYMQQMQQQQYMQQMQAQQFNQMNGQQFQGQQMGFQGQPMNRMQPICSPAFEAPHLSQQEQIALDRMVAENKPTAVMDFNGDVHGTAEDNPSNGVGPAPFPLNLLPGNAMQMLQRSHAHANVPQARFGSWHGASSLPESGFHTYLPRRAPRLFNYTTAPVPQTASAKTTRRTKGKPGMSAPTAPQTAAGKAKPVVVATYPAYSGIHGAAY